MKCILNPFFHSVPVGIRPIGTETQHNAQLLLYYPIK